MSATTLLGGLAQTILTFTVFIVLAIFAFFVTVFVVSTGASLAGYDPDGNFVVLSASLLVVAAILGGLPLGESASAYDTDPSPDDASSVGYQ